MTRLHGGSGFPAVHPFRWVVLKGFNAPAPGRLPVRGHPFFAEFPLRLVCGEAPTDEVVSGHLGSSTACAVHDVIDTTTTTDTPERVVGNAPPNACAGTGNGDVTPLWQPPNPEPPPPQAPVNRPGSRRRARSTEHGNRKENPCWTL